MNYTLTKTKILTLGKTNQPNLINNEENEVKIWEDGEQLYNIDFSSFLKPIEEKNKINDLYVKGHELNNLNGSEWTHHSKSVEKFDSPITKKRKLHGAAFPISLAKHFIEIYSKRSDTILDPFAGVGTTLDAANILNRHSIGIELNDEFIKQFNTGIDPKDGIPNHDYKRIIIQDSALNVTRYLCNEVVDFILTSPPYSNLLNKIRENFADKDFNGNIYKNQSRKLAKPYSNLEDDLGNLSYKEYLVKMKELFTSLYQISKPGIYNAWVVRDYREVQNNVPYVSLHSDIIKIAESTGWVMWDLIIWDQSNQRKLVRLGGNKARRFYFNIGHSFIIVFRKNLKGEKF